MNYILDSTWPLSAILTEKSTYQITALEFAEGGNKGIDTSCAGEEQSLIYLLSIKELRGVIHPSCG
jgi:hypothetical protein